MDFELPKDALALPGTPAPFTLPANAADGFTLPGEAESAGVTDSANDDKFDPADHYLKNGETPEAMDFAAKVAEYRAHHPKGKLERAAGFLKGAWNEIADTGEDIGHGFTGKLGQEPKSGLGSFAQGVTHAATTAIQSLADHPKSVQVYDWSSETQPAWIKRMGARIAEHDRLLGVDREERTKFIQGGGKPEDYASVINPADAVDPEDRADYDRVVGRQFEVAGMLRGGALKGGESAIKAGRAVKGLFSGGDEALSTDDWKERIAVDAELHKTAANIRQGKVDNTGAPGAIAPVPEVDDATRERLLKEGAFTQKGIESGSVVADPGNILLMEGLRLPIVSKATGAALKLTGKAAEFTGGVADKVLGHGAGKVLATGGGILAGYELGKQVMHGNLKPLGVALALLTARVALKRGGATMGEAGSELMNPEAFNSRAATAAAKAGETEAAGAGPAALEEGSPAGQAVSNFLSPADNAAAASRVARRTIQGVGVGVTGSLPIAALSDNPEQAGHAVAGGVAFGGVLGPLHAAMENPSLDRAMEINKAATRLLADKGAATTFEDPALQKAHNEGVKDLSYTTRTYFDALKGLLSGFKSKAGNPMNIAVLNAPDYAAQLAKRAPGADPDAAGKSRAFYDSATGTILVNKGEGPNGLRVDSAGHETGHFITDEVMGQMGRAYGDALRNAVEGGLFDGNAPTPEFQRFIDDYNSKTPGTKIPSGKSVNPGDILRHRAVSEYLAETTRNILGDPTPGRFILPKDVSDRMADKMVKMYGDAAGAKQDIFSRTDLPTIHAALADVIFDLGRGLKPQQRRAGSPRRPTGEAVAPQDGSAPSPESGAGTPEAPAPGAPPNPAMPGNPAEPYADIGLTPDQVDAARDFHVNFPGMEPEAQRSNKKKGIPAKSKDARADELGQEWDDAFEKYAEYLRTNGLKAPKDPQSFHQAVIDFYLKSDAGANPNLPRPGTPPPSTGSADGGQKPSSSIESKTGILEQPEPGQEPESHGGGLLAPQPLTEEAIRERITEAENKAVQSPEFGKKRSEKTRAAMQKEARVRAALEAAHESAGDSPDALRKVTDEDGVTSYKGRLDPETIPAHKILLDEMGITPDGQAAISLLDDQVGKTVYLDYKSALKTDPADVTGAQRAEEQAANTPDARRAGAPSTEQKGKAFHVLGFKVFPKKGSVTLFGFSPDKWISNVGKLVEHLNAEGQPTGYSSVNDALLAKDMEAVVENHKHGWKGDGSAAVAGVPVDEGYTPQSIPPERFNVLNASLNIDVSTKRGSDSAATEAGALAAQERAIDNGVDVDAETGDVNPLRAFINKSGKLVSTNAAGKVREGTAQHLETVYENIAPDLVTGLSDAPGGRQIVRPVGFKGDPGFPVRKGIPRGDYTASGFMPDEGKGALEDAEPVKPGEDGILSSSIKSKMPEKAPVDWMPAEGKVRAASIRLKDGEVIDAPTHSFAYDKANEQGKSLAGVEEGFTLKDGTFIHRDEAYRRFGGSTTEDFKPKKPVKQSISDDDLLAALREPEFMPDENASSIKSKRTDVDPLGFYSGIARIVDSPKIPNKGTGEQMLNTLKAAGVKAEEMAHLGMEEFLKTHDGPVTKKELAEFVKAGGVRFEEVQKGASSSEKHKALREAIQDGINGTNEDDLDADEFPSWADDADTLLSNGEKALEALDAGDYETAAEIARENSNLENEYGDNPAWGEAGRIADDKQGRFDHHAPNPTKFSQYKLPGGENYKEVLLTLPRKIKSFDSFMRENWGDEWRASARPGFEERQRGNYERAGSESRGGADEGALFKSAHWDEPNVLAHIRQADHVDTEGNKVRLIEEIQSDWHQKGRKEGYAKSEKAEVKQDSGDGGWYVVDPSTGNYTRSKPYQSQEEAKTAADYLNERGGFTGVPDAPFKKTWAELAFKRALRMAVEDGMDKIAWTPGDKQAERYDLSKQIDSLQYSKNSDGTYAISAIKDGNSVFSELSMAEGKLADTVGKELAQKIVAGEDGKKVGKSKELSGLDLKVGGEGMKGFYDKILPDFVRKYVKKWEGRVETADVVTGENKNGMEVLDSDGSVIHETEYDSEAHQIARENPGATVRPASSKPITQSVHSVTITPEMRKAIMDEGQPMFMPNEGKEGPTGNINRARIKKLGYTNDLREAGYITPGGRMIDLSGKREGGTPGTRNHDHREAGGTSGMLEFQNEGNIRVSPESGGIDMLKKPTSSQEAQIKRWVEHFKGEVYLDLYDGLGEYDERNEMYRESPRRTSLEFPDGTKPVKVLGMIRRFYNGEDIPSGKKFMPSEGKAFAGAPADGAPPVPVRAGRGALEPDDEEDTVPGLARK